MKEKVNKNIILILFFLCNSREIFQKPRVNNQYQHSVDGCGVYQLCLKKKYLRNVLKSIIFHCLLLNGQSRYRKLQLNQY